MDLRADRPRQASSPTGCRVVRRQADPSNSVALYLRDISTVPLLTAEDEVMLARAIEAGVLAEARLTEDTCADTDERADLSELVVTGQQSRDVLIESNLRLVVSLAKSYAGCGTSMLDLVQEGNLGLMRAVERFDYRRGFKFSTYATWWIRQAIARGYGEQGRSIRVPVHVVEAIQRLRRQQRQLLQDLGRRPTIEELSIESELSAAKVLDLLKLAEEPISLDLGVGDGEGATLSDLIVGDDSEGPINEVSRQSMRREIDALLATISAREQLVLRLRFGLRDERPHTLEEVGAVLGVTRERVRQLEMRALIRIRGAHSVEGCREYLRA